MSESIRRTCDVCGFKAKVDSGSLKVWEVVSQAFNQWLCFKCYLKHDGGSNK